MVEITKEQLRQLQLNILDFFSRVCEENNIRYWLEFGSLIGAVRHQGYIPWDDDIDVGMLRDDYNKLRDILKDDSGRYVLHDVDNDNQYNFLFPKIYDTRTIEFDPNAMQETSVNIDIFIFDSIPSDQKKQKRFFKKRDILRRLNDFQVLDYKRATTKAKRICSYILKNILKVFPKNYFICKANNYIQRYNKIQTKVVGNTTGYMKIAYDVDKIYNTIIVPFEDRFYRIPEEFDYLLTLRYGDYMQLPPVEKRIPAHQEIKAYFLEKA